MVRGTSSASAVSSVPIADTAPRPASALQLLLTVCGAGLLVVDVCADVLTSILLLTSGQLTWGAVTAVWPLLAAIVTLLLDGASVPDSPVHLTADRGGDPKFSPDGKISQQQQSQQRDKKHLQQENQQQQQQPQHHLQQEYQQQQHQPQENLQHRHELHQEEHEQQHQHTDLDVGSGPCECARCPSPKKSPPDVHDLQQPENGDLRHAKQRRYRGGLMHRYMALFQQQMQPDALTGSAAAERSTALCHLYQAAVQSAPQLVLQLFGVLQLRRDQPFIFVCAVTSLANLVWAVASHSRFPSIFPENSSTAKEVSAFKQDSCHPENESLPNAMSASKPTETISNSSDHSNSQDRRNSSIRNSRICHSRSDSGLDNSYRGSSSLPKLIDRNLKTTSGLRSSSLPSKPGTGYQAMYLSHAFVSSGLLDVPVKRIKEHKFGSVITLKERNLMTNSSNVNVLGGNELGSVGTLDARPCSSTRLLLGLRVLSCLLLLTARLTGLTAAAILVGPWLYMTACVHMTVMFVLVVSERPHFSAVLWRDVVMSLATAVVFCTTVTPLTMQSCKWRHAVGQAVLAVENMMACALLYAVFGHRGPHLALALLVAFSAITFLGCGLLFLICLLDRRQREQELSDLELGCVSPYCGRHSNAATLALPEDSSSAYSGSTDSNYGSSSTSPSDELTESQTAGAPLERQTGLLCSVQDLLANMSCLNEDMQLRDTDEISHENLGAEKEGRNGVRDTCGGVSLLDQHGFLTRSVDLNSEPWNSGRPLSTLGFNVHDSSEARTKESRVKSSKIFLSRSFSREIQNYDGFDQGSHYHSAFKTNANYENYPSPCELIGETQAILPVPTCAVNSPSSLERSVTREYDERLQEVLDTANDVSSLANSSSNSLCTYSGNGGLQKQFPQEPNSREGFRLCESETSTSILRGGDAQHELTCVSDTDMRLVNAPQTSPSSLYSSLNNSESTECDTAVEVKLHSFHRPPSSNVEHSVVRKLSSVRRKLSTDNGNKKHDYENVYEDNSNLNFESQISMPSDNLASRLISMNQPITSSQDYAVEQKRSTEGVLSRFNSLDEKECVDKTSRNDISTSLALPLPLPPRTYIIRYPYQHFPRPLLKLSDSANHSNNSSNHDYENLPPLNVNRGVFGVRHWKAYLDIEDRAHDYSTYKDKSKINSTASSSLTSDCSGLKHSSRIRKSLAEDGESVLSRSLPDLSNLVLEACIEVPEGENGAERPDTVNEKLPDNVRLLSVLNTLRATKPLRTNSVDDLSNYETIWIDELDEGGKSGNEVNQSDLQSRIIDTINTEHSSLITTIGDVKAKGSLCNLYYSRMSDLSRRFYSDTLRQQSISSHHQASQDGISQCSTNNSFADNETIQSSRASVKVKKTPALQGISECAEEQQFDVPNSETCSSPFSPTEDKNSAKTERELNYPLNNQLLPLAVKVDVMDMPKPKRKFSILRERFEGQRWTPLKSPLKFHSPAKALQAGLRVFNRPRVHIITPSDDDEIETFGGKLTSPFKLKPKILSTPPSITTNKNDTPSVKRNAKVMENVLGDEGNPPENPHPVTSSNASRTTSSLRTTQQTPLSSSVRKVQKTPKTSTPDNARSKNNRCESSVDSSKCDSIAVTAPKHSTPEAVGNHLPQLSTISGLSSVVESPELSRISSVYGPLPRTYSSARGVENGMKRLPLSENVRWGDMVNRMGNMPSMTSIKEKENRLQEVGSLNFASCNSNSRPFQINRGIHVVDTNENHYQGVPVARLNPASKNIYTIFHDQQKVLRNNRTPAGYPRLADQCYEDSVFIAPLPVSAYGITNQRSTLTPNSKIFDKKI